MKTAIIKLSNKLSYICLWSAIASLGVMLLTVCIQVVARYLFLSPPAWTEELARYAMVWCGLLGATASFKINADPALFEYKDLQSSVLTSLRKRVIEASVLIFMVACKGIFSAAYPHGLDRHCCSCLCCGYPHTPYCKNVWR